MNIAKSATTIGLVVAGVIAAGYILSSLQDVPFIAKAREGFDV